MSYGVFIQDGANKSRDFLNKIMNFFVVKIITYLFIFNTAFSMPAVWKSAPSFNTNSGLIREILNRKLLKKKIGIYLLATQHLSQSIKNL